MTLVQESPQERTERYMRQATEVARLAARAGDQDIAATYLEMARVWLRLADEVRPGPTANEDHEQVSENEAARR